MQLKDFNGYTLMGRVIILSAEEYFDKYHTNHAEVVKQAVWIDGDLEQDYPQYNKYKDRKFAGMDSLSVDNKPYLLLLVD